MRDMRLLIRRLADQGMTVLLSSHLMAEVEELCDRVVIIANGRVRYEGALDELIATTAGRYELRTTDDERAQQIATAQRGIDDLVRDARGLTFAAAGEGAATALSIALGEAGVGIAALVPRTATLEELFFRMTEGAAADASAAAPDPEGVSNDRRPATTDRHTPRTEEEEVRA
jgi:ABC-2 type transport system ATP-binding protein